MNRVLGLRPGLLVLLIILCCQTVLQAQITKEDYLHRLQISADSSKTDISLQLETAYQYMQTGNPLQATKYYQRAVNIDSHSLPAWQGLLWASNSMKQWHTTIIRSKQALAIFPTDSTLLLLAAQAEFDAYNAPNALTLYTRADASAGREMHRLNRIGALQGRAAVYAAYDEYAKAQHYYRESMKLSADSLLPAGLDYLYSLHNATTLYYIKHRNSHAYGIEQNATYNALSLTAGYESYGARGDWIRDGLSLRSAYSGLPTHLFADGYYLKGSGSQYPAYALQVRGSLPLHLNDWMFTPGYGYSYSHYPDFDTRQQEAGIAIAWQRLNLDYRTADILEDVESTGADSHHNVTHISVGYLLPHGINPVLTVTLHPRDWYVSPLGYVVDSSPNEKLLLSGTINLPLPYHAELFYTQNAGRLYGKWQLYGSLAATVRY